MSLDRKLNERHRIGGCRCVWDRTFTAALKIILRCSWSEKDAR